MSALRTLLARVAGLFHRGRRDRELDEEFELHLAMQIEDNLRAGMTPAAARRDALLSAGGVESAKESYRDQRGLPWLEALGQDVRYSLRMIRKAPGFAAVVILTLALGIGANTAIFSVVHAALTPLAIPEPDRVVMVWTDNLTRDWHEFPASAADYVDWRASGVFSSLGAFDNIGVNVRAGDATVRVNGARVTAGFFGALATPAQAGRVLGDADMRPGHDQAVVISDRLWRSLFHADPAIVDASVVVDGAPRTVVGVLPPRFPRLGQEDLYVPMALTPAEAADRASRSLGVVGRLSPGLGFAAAQQRIARIAADQARQYPDDAGNTARLQRAGDAYVEDARTLLALLFGAVGFVLLIACANIANLLLARGAARTREIAIRAALGGGRWRLVRQLLTENVVLAAIGGAVALAPAVWGLRFVAAAHVDELPNADLIGLDARVLVFNFALAVVTGVVFGAAPAWLAWKTDVNGALKATGVASGRAGWHQRFRSAFVVAELALTLVLLVGAGLMVQSFVRARAADPGYRSANVLTMDVALSARQYDSPDRQAAFFARVLDRARELPGVVAASAVDELPTSDSLHGGGLSFPDRPEPRAEDIPIVLVNSVTSDYFKVMQIPLVRGRAFDRRDSKDAPPAVIIDRWTAEKYWPGRNPVGQQVRLGRQQPPREIVGVVGALGQPVFVKLVKGRLGQAYLPIAQAPKPKMSLAFRVEGDPSSIVPAVRAAVRGVDVDQPIFKVQTMDEARAAGRASLRLATSLLGAFAVVALLLAAIGLYGLMTYNVGQRTREYGIRLSLGARPADVLGLAVRQALVLMTAGLAVGLAGALALTRVMSSLLYGIGATDPATFAGVTGVLAIVGLVAGGLPARRATRVDPAITLRAD